MARGIALVMALLLAGCGQGETTEEAYDRGWNDGWVDTCDSIAAYSRDIERALERQHIC